MRTMMITKNRSLYAGFALFTMVNGTKNSMNKHENKTKKLKPNKTRNLLFIHAYGIKYGIVRYEDIARYIELKPRTWHRYISELRHAGVRLVPRGGMGKMFDGYDYLGFDPLAA